jgi:hypothetical protein
MDGSENVSPQTNMPESEILKVIGWAREEITWVRSAYKYAVSIIAVIIVVGLYFSHKSIQDLKSDLRTEGEQFQSRLTTESSLLARTLQKNLEDEIRNIRSEVSNRINEEFKQENISELVTQQAQLRIDTIADSIIEKQITDQINPLRKDLTTLISSTTEKLQTKVAQLDSRLSQSKNSEEKLRDLLAEVKKTTEEVKKQSDFVITVLAAQSDDREAFEKIQFWANDTNFPLQDQAKSAEFNIIKSHAGFNDPHMLLNWPDGLDPSKMSIEDIRSNWRQLPSQFARAYVEFVWKHDNITKEQKLIFLHDALKDSRGSLQAANWAANTLEKEAKIEYKSPFDFSRIEKWWVEREDTSQEPGKATNK